MLPFYLTQGYKNNVEKVSAELKAQMPNLSRFQADAELKKQREKNARREAFEKKASEIGYEKALVEASTKVDTAIAEAKTALASVIGYKK